MSRSKKLIIAAATITIIVAVVIGLLIWQFTRNTSATTTLNNHSTTSTSQPSMDPKTEVFNLYESLKQALKDKDNTKFQQISDSNDVVPFTQIANIILKLNRSTPASFNSAQNKLILNQAGCGKQVELTVKLVDNKLKFTDLSHSLQLLCLPKDFVQTTIACAADCWLAPVDKTYGLPSTYTPQLVTTDLPVDCLVTQETKEALQKMFTEADNQGIDMKIVSAYRSYDKQKTVFEGWVKGEMDKGHNRAAAEKLANTYSAYPGHSEHQLGTTVDLACVDCAAFDNSVGNLKVYKFIEENAHLFGFVVSYPKDTQHLTGYKYEPWHVRYVGKELATELFKTGYLQGNGNNLAYSLSLRFDFADN